MPDKIVAATIKLNQSDAWIFALPCESVLSEGSCINVGTILSVALRNIDGVDGVNSEHSVVLVVPNRRGIVVSVAVGASHVEAQNSNGIL